MLTEAPKKLAEIRSGASRALNKILVRKEPEPQVYTSPLGEQGGVEHTGHAPPEVETGTPGKDLDSAPKTPRHTGHGEREQQTAEDFVMESFRGPAAKGFDWGHIMDNHAPWGKVAQQSGRKNIFENMTENEIKKAVRNAWRNREKIETQKRPNQPDRIRYQGNDTETRYVIEIWQNKETGEIETAYPINN